MTPVSQFAQHLLKLDPQRHPPRFTLFNFLKSMVEPSTPFTPAVIQNFYFRVLQFDHWQSEAQALGQVVAQDIHSFWSQHGLSGEYEPWKELRHPDTLQVVPLKVHQDVAELIQNDHAARLKSGDHLRIHKISEQQTLAALLSPSGSLEVKVYPHMAIVWGAQLKPVSPVTHLHYTSELDLTPHVRQILEGSLLTNHCFHVDSEGVHGIVTRGPTLQKFETFIRAQLSESQDLFYALKKLERHFIEPQSDPYYQEIVSKLERANRLLTNPTPNHLAEAERTLNRGRVSLKNIFPNDRLLGLLITHLEYGIQERRTAHPPQ